MLMESRLLGSLVVHLGCRAVLIEPFEPQTATPVRGRRQQTGRSITHLEHCKERESSRLAGASARRVWRAPDTLGTRVCVERERRDCGESCTVVTHAVPW